MCYLVKWCQQNGQPSFHTKCRKCLECRQERAREWGLRNAMEHDQHQAGCFITLTYAVNPVVLIKEDLQNFKKRLRKKLHPLQVKTFDCGEYGDLHMRPHFHVLIHGYDFPDKYQIEDSRSGHPQYMSDTLDKLWSLGNERGKSGQLIGRAVIQDLTIDSAAYCALYAAKPTKFLPEHLQGHPEFNTMSKNLGVDAIMKNMETYLLTDEIYYDGKRYRIPQTVLNKYFEQDLKFKKLGIMETEKLKRYYALKDRRSERGAVAWQMQTSDVTPLQCYQDKRYRKENAIKRLTKSPDL